MGLCLVIGYCCRGVRGFFKRVGCGFLVVGGIGEGEGCEVGDFVVVILGG